MNQNDTQEYEYNFFASLYEREERRVEMMKHARQLENIIDAKKFAKDMGVHVDEQ